MDDWAVISNANYFEWYKAELDCAAKYHHAHNGIPKEYPCKVKSTWRDDPYGRYTYDHEFIYLKEIVCENCGHKQHEWPAIEDDKK